MIANTMKNMGIESTFVDPDISVEELSLQLNLSRIQSLYLVRL